MAGKSLNKVMLIGNAGKDTEIRYTGSGRSVGNFTIATNESWKDKTSGQLQERTEWHNIVVWDRLAEICRDYVKKGKRVYVEGRIQTRSWDDKDGNKRYTTEIIAQDLILLDGAGSPGGNNGGNSQSNYRPATNAASSGASAVPEYEPQEPAPVDDLPF